MESYVQKGKDFLRKGFTTGTCAAAAAKAAAAALFASEKLPCVSVILPSGETVSLEIAGNWQGEGWAQCCVVKDAGDDPDITNGMEVHARVSMLPDGDSRILIDGGEGVGRVTMPGLDQPPGEAAINSVPRQMIRQAVSEVMEKTGGCSGVQVTISIPGGEKKALSTLNPVLGIEGGLSVLGTSGIVEPMSEKALLDTIRVRIRQELALQEMGQKAEPVVLPKEASGMEAGSEKETEKSRILLMAPGNYGLDFLKSRFGIDPDRVIKISNFIGESIDLAVSEGAAALVLAGHIGKLVKLAGGIMNTHSSMADARLEILASNALLAGADADTCRRMLACPTTDGALAILAEEYPLDDTMSLIIEKAAGHLARRAGTGIEIGIAMFSYEFGLLGCSRNFEELLTRKQQNTFC